MKKHTISQIVLRCQQCGCPVRILPGIYQLATGNVTVSALREVEISDLLGREQVQVNLDEVMGYIEDKTVLVRGEDIVLIVGRRTDDRYRVGHNTENILKITKLTI